MESAFSIPQDVTFQEAIALTQSLLDRLESEALSESELESALAQLVASENGARGFFVTYLTDDREFADRPHNAAIQALKSSPLIVAELLVKNLAMSTAMEITHQRHNDPEMATGSRRVQRRSAGLMERLANPEIHQKVNALLANIQTGTGEYQTFLERWEYDSQQKEAIALALKPFARE